MTSIKKVTAVWTTVCMIAMLLAAAAPGGMAHAADDGAILFQDDFSGAALSSDWSVLAGAYAITDGALTATNVNSAIAAGEPEWTDYTVEAKVRLNNNGAYGGILFRVQDLDNNYWLRLYKPASGTARVELLRRVNNTPATLATYNAPLSINVWYTLKVEVKGNQIQGYLNGERIIEATDAQFAAGSIGLRNLTQTMSADDVIVSRLAADSGGEPKVPVAYDPVVVATYAGQQPALPDSISGRAIDNSVVDPIFVDWELPADADYSQAFGDAIEVTGKAYLKDEDDGTRYDLELPAKAYIEVVPEQLNYFIDAGASNPYIYDAVQKLSGNVLLNGAANQPYDAASGWGYIALGSDGSPRPIINKSDQPDLDKHATGMMIDGGDPLSTLSYRLDGLEGGKSYRFTSYHRLWWGNEMPIKISLEYSLNGQKVTQTVNRLHLDHAGHSRKVSYSVELPAGASDVRYVLTNAGSYTAGPGAGKTNRNAAISWLAVEELASPAQPVVYSSLGGVAGDNTDVWFDTNGVPIQAHGGQVTWVRHVVWNGEEPAYTANPGEGDGAWLWVGEDKTYGGRPIGGIHTYVSKDLYNWVDMGVALYPHRVFPVEKTADGQGVQPSDSQLEALKARAMGTPGTGTNELGEPLSAFDIDYARDFLQAYVDRSAHPDYSREHDGSFDYIAASYDEASLRLAFDRTYAYYTIMERPKMLYNDRTNQYVIVYHVDGPSDARILEFYDTLKNSPAVVTAASRYSRAQMGFAVSESPFGPFKLVNAQRMNYIEGYYDSSKGMARDMTVFQDDDGKAYAIYSSEENRYTYISLLNDDYTGPANHGTEGLGETFTARVFSEMNREAPAIFKYNGYYYFITSGTTGWDPNPSIAYRANHIFGNTADGGRTFTPYTNLGNPFPNDSTNTSYRTQSTAVIPYDAENGKFIYMGDRWIQRALETSGYVWIPLRIAAGGTKVEGVAASDWTLDMLDELAPLQVLTTVEKPFPLGEAVELPATLDVRQGSNVYEGVPVSWDPVSLEAARRKLGTAIVQGTLGGSGGVAGRTVEFEVTVSLPEHMLYFVNPSSGEVAQYTGMVSEYTARTGKPLLHDAAEQSYDPQSGRSWGYVGSNSTVRSSTADIFQSLRYVNSSSNRDLTYKFDLEQGAYHVYIGFYDPWFSSSQSGRVANTAINGTAVESDRIINGSYEAAVHRDIMMDEDGTMEIVVSPARSGNNTDVQLSWIIIASADADAGPETDKAALQELYDAHKDIENDNYTEASWSRFQNALAGAVAVLEDEEATQQQADDAWQALTDAVAGLERKPSPISGGWVIAPANEPVITESSVVMQPVSDENGAERFKLEAAHMREAIDLLSGGALQFVLKSGASASSVELEFPLAQLREAAGDKVAAIAVSSDLGRMVLERKLLDAAEAENAEHLQLSIARVEPSALPQDAREQVRPDVPVYEYRLKLDGREIAAFGAGEVTVEMPYALRPGETADKIVVYRVAESGGELELIKNARFDPATGMIRFSPRSFGYYVPAYVDRSFADLHEAEWARGYIEALAARDAVNGVGQELFQPNGRLTRAQFVTMLAQLFELEGTAAQAGFSDTAEDAWYSASVASARAWGIVEGKPDGSFGVDDPISRQDMAVMLYRASQALGLQWGPVSAAPPFSDRDGIAPYAAEAVAVMAHYGIVNGMGDNSFAPRGLSTRAQAAAVLYRMFMLQQEAEVNGTDTE